MERHRFDPLSFVFGVLFVAVAGVALLGVELFALRDLAWVLPALLVIVGAALLIGSAARRNGDHDDASPATADTVAIDEPSDGEDVEVPRG